ncbi:hypothetical protein H6P81_001223 [Aristolochia fimbriata]|uniref:Uncharacterized protein n=1 Tax=Aristolochia fimbriata TaxID=158543 RepID=A0AAV7F8Y2_ARIFI|nr:hypothetical protein H6P81_001223 [Aristolochia fimbriata]
MKTRSMSRGVTTRSMARAMKTPALTRTLSTMMIKKTKRRRGMKIKYSAVPLQKSSDVAEKKQFTKPRARVLPITEKFSLDYCKNICKIVYEFVLEDVDFEDFDWADILNDEEREFWMSLANARPHHLTTTS